MRSRFLPRETGEPSRAKMVEGAASDGTASAVAAPSTMLAPARMVPLPRFAPLAGAEPGASRSACHPSNPTPLASFQHPYLRGGLPRGGLLPFSRPRRSEGWCGAPSPAATHTRSQKRVPLPALRTRRFRGEDQGPRPSPGTSRFLGDARGLATRLRPEHQPRRPVRHRPPSAGERASRTGPCPAFAPDVGRPANAARHLLRPDRYLRPGRERRPGTTGNGISPRPRCPRREGRWCAYDPVSRGIADICHTKKRRTS